ncbi:hypothetical protein OCAR_7516 [Afipia carboxidovorans OM5]|nr:hypothetical protein OCAR_7516 [Afipia carboxidovorans OM5]
MKSTHGRYFPSYGPCVYTLSEAILVPAPGYLVPNGTCLDFRSSAELVPL